MSYCKQEGKDKIIFVTKEEHESSPPQLTLKPLDPEESGPRGLIKSDGTINWGCPCLGGMASGPCGYEFRQAFTCFHESKAEPKGRDCLDQFNTMQECLTRYPNLYPSNRDESEESKDGQRAMAEMQEIEEEGKSLGPPASRS